MISREIVLKKDVREIWIEWNSSTASKMQRYCLKG
jgi:hypothetical protein